MLPILHLNGYKIANPTVLARIPEERARALCSRATATGRSLVTGDDPEQVHRDFAAALDDALDEIAGIQQPRATDDGRPRWPMIVLRTPKGWTGPKEVDGLPGRGHVALAPGAARRTSARTPSTSRLLEEWLRSYRPEELFDDARAGSSPSSPRCRRRATGG